MTMLSAWCAVALLLPAGVGDMFLTTSKDFGNVPYGSANVHEFVLRNTSQEEVQVSTVQSSCHCATPRIVKDRAAPGEELIVEVTYDASKFSGPRSMTITVNFLKPYGERAFLRVNGVSRTDVTLNPSQVDFGTVPKGSSPSKTVAIQYNGGSPWKIEEVLPHKWLDVKVTPGNQGGTTSYALAVALKPDIPTGTFADAIQVTTNDPVTPVMNVRVAANIEAPLVASPSSLQFGNVKTGEKVAKRIILKGNEPFSIKWVKGQSESLQVLCTEGMRKMHVLQVELTPMAVGEETRTLDVMTDLGKGEELPLPLSATVLP